MTGAKTGSRDPWEGCPPGWQRVLVYCERGEPGTRAHHRKLLGRGWVHRFGDGFPAVGFDPGAQYITRTGIRHADGGVTFRFGCPYRWCGHRPEAREEKLGAYLLGLLALGKRDAPQVAVLNAGILP